MAVTQQQVANIAKVSRSTVAAVFSESQRDRISLEVQRRVQETAERLGYRPNRHALIMRGVRSNCIGILNFNAMRPLALRKVKAATEALLKHGYEWKVEETLWYHSLGGDAISRAVERLEDARVEGLLLVYPHEKFTQQILDRLLRAKLPVVSIAGDHLKGIPNYVSDRAWGYEQITRHLIEGGYRRLVMMSSNAPSEENGFLRALRGEREAKALSELIPVGGLLDRVRSDSVTSETLDYRLGEAGMKMLLKRPTLPEAILWTNDHRALGALKTCRHAGVRVPDELAVVGFDGTLEGQYGAIPLTTLDHPAEAITNGAIECLLEWIKSGIKPKAKVLTTRGQLIVRDSCGLSTHLSSLSSSAKS